MGQAIGRGLCRNHSRTCPCCSLGHGQKCFQKSRNNLGGQVGLESAAAVIESWANGVEWQFAQQRYRVLFGIPNYRYCDNYQNQEINADRMYTSIVVDMIDNENQRAITGDVAFPQDRVENYSILQVEQGIRGATSWNDWRNNMVNRHTNPSRGFLNELFANWH